MGGGPGKEKHKLESDGVLGDGVSHYPATVQDMQQFAAASESLSKMPTPVLHDAKNPASRMFVASFDGTGNDAINDPEHETNVARTHREIAAGNQQGDTNIISRYVSGPGTQEGFFARTWDGARGHTYDQRLEAMYAMFIVEAKEWKDENPDAVITVASTGFSRGAEQAAGFTRLVHERGIQDPDGAVYQRDRNNQIIGVTYSKEPLQAPGSIAQAVALYDPVGTGVPVNDKDRRLPPSVISGFQIVARDERRGLFPATHIIDQGMTADGRLLAVTIPGVHSSAGGGYHRDGLGARSANLMTDYLNGLSNQPFLEKREESQDPRMNVIHRSEEGMLLYQMGSKVDRQSEGGYIERLVPKHMVDKVADPNNAEPRDEALNARFARQQVTIGPVPGQVAATATPERPLTPDMPGHPDHALHQQIRQKVEQMDAGLGRSYDATSERMTASLLTVAKANGMERVDHVMLSRDSTAGPAGQHVFLVQGNADDALRMRLQVNTAEALSVPVESSWKALENINQQQEAQRQQERDNPQQAASAGMRM